MFEGFKDDLMFLSEKEIRRIKPSKYQSDRTFDFDCLHSNMPLIFFSSPEIRTIQRASLFRELQNFDCAFHLQNLPMSIVPLLRKSSFFRKLICKMVNKQQRQLERNEKNEKSVIVCTYIRNQNSIVECLLHSDSSFRLTGAFCAAIVFSIIKGYMPIIPGIFTFEDININLQLLNKILKDNNINISIKK